MTRGQMNGATSGTQFLNPRASSDIHTSSLSLKIGKPPIPIWGFSTTLHARTLSLIAKKELPTHLKPSWFIVPRVEDDLLNIKGSALVLNKGS